MKLAIVKYNAGNVQSLTFALNRLGIEPMLTDDPDELFSADKVIFPGQGEASSAMRSLKRNGLDHVLSGLKQPFLGVCLGMQLMCERTEENHTECLGIIPVQVKKFIPNGIKVPHMGWNDITKLNSPLLKGVNEGSYIYFVHSYYLPVCEYTTAECTYDVPFTALLQKDNFYAIQAHPEKSAEPGMTILENFIKL